MRYNTQTYVLPRFLCLISVLATGCNRLPVPERATVQILQDNLGLSRELVFESDAVGRISDIRAGVFLDSEPGLSISVVGDRGAAILDASFAPVSTTPFDDSVILAVRAIVDFGSGQLPGYLSGMSSDSGARFRGVRLLSHSGKEVWSDRDYFAVDFADIDNDGTIEFVVGRLVGSDGSVALLDHTGNVVWERTTEGAHSPVFADADSDGQLDVVIHRGQSSPIIYDQEGNLLTHDVSPTNVFHRSRFPTAFDEIHFISLPKHEGSQGAIFDPLANLVFQFDALVPFETPTSAPLGFPRARAVRLDPSAEAYVALTRNFAWDDDPTNLLGTLYFRTELTIYDSEGILVYHEILGPSLSGIGVLASGEDGEEHLLIGIEGKMYRYSID